MVLAPNLQSQESASQSLADDAREQRELRSSPKPAKTYGNDDVEPPGSGARWKTQKAASKPPTHDSQPSRPAQERLSAEADKPQQHPGRSVLDHRVDPEDRDTSDDRVVPEGTELKIEVPAVPESPAEVYAARVVAPVRVDFATAIPALSAATVQVVTRHYPYQDRSWYGGYNSGYFEALEVTQIVVEGVPYAVQTDQVGRAFRVASPTELTFKLLKPLSIER
jgi:hypothetical protein